MKTHLFLLAQSHVLPHSSTAPLLRRSARRRSSSIDGARRTLIDGRVLPVWPRQTPGKQFRRLSLVDVGRDGLLVGGVGCGIVRRGRMGCGRGRGGEVAGGRGRGGAGTGTGRGGDGSGSWVLKLPSLLLLVVRLSPAPSPSRSRCLIEERVLSVALVLARVPPPLLLVEADPVVVVYPRGWGVVVVLVEGCCERVEVGSSWVRARVGVGEGRVEGRKGGHAASGASGSSS